MAGQDLDFAEGLAAEAHNHARHPSVAHDEVGAQPDHRERNVAWQAGEKIGEIVLIGRREQSLRRPTDAKPRVGGERLVRGKPAAQITHLRTQRRDDVGKAHALSPAASCSGKA